MSTASIPVDLFNPGQVFACLGFLEAADVLLGDAEGGFDWSKEGSATFAVSTGSERNPFETVLEFLAEAEPKRCGPIGYADPPPKKGKSDNVDDGSEDDDGVDESAADSEGPALDLTPTFLAKAGDRMALPIRIGGGNRPIVELGHWADGSSRESFKLYAGNRSADRIARAMLKGVRKKATGKQKANGQSGDLKTKGVMQLWEEDRAALIKAPFDVLTPMGGSFNFDPRGAWTAIDAGYSPNEHKHAIQASPVVEFLAAWGLEHARPVEFGLRQVLYATWGVTLPSMLARAAARA
jgi:CRISPR-associated protein Csb3